MTDTPVSVRNGDVFLMCSDGFWEYVEDTEMLATLEQAHSASAWLARMERTVIAAGRKDQDNYSALTVWCGDRESRIPQGGS